MVSKRDRGQGRVSHIAKGGLFVSEDSFVRAGCPDQLVRPQMEHVSSADSEMIRELPQMQFTIRQN